MEEDALREINRRLDHLDAQLRELTRLAQETRTLVGPFGVTLPDGTVLVQTIWGHKLVVDALDTIMTPNLIVYRQWEADLSSLMAGYAAPDTVFVDVGANIGYFTCLVAGRIGPGGSGRVIAIEPNPHCVDLLKRNVAINWSLCPVDIQPVGASDRTGVASLVVPENRLANAHLTATVGDPSAATVPIQRLDQLLANVSRVDLLKIDVEGHERSVLQGACEVVQRNPGIRIIMEWSIEQMMAAGTTPDAMLDVITGLKLAACKLPASLHNLQIEDLAYSREELKGTPYANILLVRSDAA